MAKRGPKNPQITKPTPPPAPPRTIEMVDGEYAQACAQAGHLEHRKNTLEEQKSQVDTELPKIYNRIKMLDQEGTAMKQAAAEANIPLRAPITPKAEMSTSPQANQ